MNCNKTSILLYFIAAVLFSSCNSESELKSTSGEDVEGSSSEGRIQFVKIVSVETEGDRLQALSMLGAALQSHGIRYHSNSHIGASIYVEAKNIDRALEALYRIKTLEGHWREVEEAERSTFCSGE